MIIVEINIENPPFYNFSQEAGVNLAGGEYIIHRVYSDQETMKLVTVAQKLSGKIVTTLLLLKQTSGRSQLCDRAQKNR